MDLEAPRSADFARYRVEPGEDFSIADHDPADTGGIAGPEEVEDEYGGLCEQIAGLQERLYAEEERALLIVLQGIDAAGKDGIVRHVMRGTYPSGVRVYSFKEPSADEEWRTTSSGATTRPRRRRAWSTSSTARTTRTCIVVRVKGLVPEELWRSRYDSINDFERMLAREGTTIVKFLLHISKDEQLEKFRERLERTDKYWKWSDNDIKERERWDDYQQRVRGRGHAPRPPTGRPGTSSPPTTAGTATTSSPACSPARSPPWTRSIRRRPTTCGTFAERELGDSS